MALIPMRAIHACDCEGRQFQPGDLFDAPAVQAAILRYQGRAQFLIVTPPVVRLEPPARTRRVYKRRDLQAEP